jgi:hypothetical protein
MNRRLRPLALLAASVVIAIAALTGLTLLPHSDYIRFQQVATESVHYLRVKWIYERIHFDRKPIDVAFIGTSHTQSGINSQVVEEELGRNGHPVHVVNFAIPHLGRDIEFLVVRELLESRRVGTLVLEVQSLEARAPHPGFQRLAGVADIAAAPVLINTGIFENWARLPMRQLILALKTASPRTFNYHADFDPSRYEGSHFDDTLRLHGSNTDRTAVFPREHFESELRDIRKDIQNKNATAAKLTFPALGGNLLYRYNDHYLNAIVELARAHGVKLVFLYIPYLDAPDAPERTAWMVGKGPMLVPKPVMHDAALWQNADHLNYYGALALSRWTAQQLAAMPNDNSAGP